MAPLTPTHPMIDCALAHNQTLKIPNSLFSSVLPNWETLPSASLPDCDESSLRLIANWCLDTTIPLPLDHSTTPRANLTHLGKIPKLAQHLKLDDLVKKIMETALAYTTTKMHGRSLTCITVEAARFLDDSAALSHDVARLRNMVAKRVMEGVVPVEGEEKNSYARFADMCEEEGLDGVWRAG